MTPEQHFTQPPPRYTEATLVKRMEELGIGRPSTYASIVSTIQEREYVRKEKNRLIPEDKGRLVTAFLANYFGRYVDYDFTADLEEDLDRVTTGEEDWKALLARFWARLLRRARRDRGPAHHRGAREDQRGAGAAPLPGHPRGPRAAPLQGLRHRPARAQDLAQRLGLHRLLELSRVPLHPPARRRRRGRRRRRPRRQVLGSAHGARLRGGRGAQPVTLRKGPYGFYVQLGEAEGRREAEARLDPEGHGPRRARPRARAGAALAAARSSAAHPEDGAPVEAGIGRFGPFVKHGKTYANLARPRGGADHRHEPRRRAPGAEGQRGGRARGQAAPRARRASRRRRGRRLRGRYGPYVKWEKVNATLPKEIAPETVTLEQALELIAAEARRQEAAAPKKPAATKAAAEEKARRPQK